MAIISGSKTFPILLLALAMSTAACGDGGTSAQEKTADLQVEMVYPEEELTEAQVEAMIAAAEKRNGVKLAYILEKTATPTKWDPEGAEVDEFKHCVQRPKGNEAMIMATYQLHLDEIKFSLETAADAKANNYKVSSPPVKLHSAELIDACPSGAKATCDRGNVIEHYYTDAQWVLAGFEKSCGYSGSDTWTQSK